MSEESPFFDDQGDIIDEPKSMATVRPDGEITNHQESQQLTPQEHRVQYVAKALEAAYMKVGTLELTDEEFKRVTEGFSDSSVDILPYNGQIYIPHIHISNRLTSVFKFQWDFIRTREWLTGNEMFAEYVLIIRGVAKGEAISSAKMQDGNRAMSYDDVLESTRGIALRRIAGKFLSCGNQVWDSGYVAEWIAKFAEKKNNKWCKKTTRSEFQPQTIKPQPPFPESGQKFTDKQVQGLHRLMMTRAEEGYAALEGAWKNDLSNDERKVLSTCMNDLKIIAKEADKKKLSGYSHSTGEK